MDPMRSHWLRTFFALLFVLGLGTSLLGGCASNPTPPRDALDNICSIYQHDNEWREAAQKSAAKWGTPEYILMAFVHQESRFKSDAQPERPFALGMLPLPRTSSAYGYAQAQDPAWFDYEKSTNRRGARKNDMFDAMDFIGWYNFQSYTRNRINRKDTYNLYLAYHEGHGGYSRGSYKRKKWLLAVARKVTRRAEMYKKQLGHCHKSTQSHSDKPATSKPVPPGYKPRHTRPEDPNEPCNAPWPYC